jgi:hypothetical protein
VLANPNEVKGHISSVEWVELKKCSVQFCTDLKLKKWRGVRILSVDMTFSKKLPWFQMGLGF